MNTEGRNRREERGKIKKMGGERGGDQGGTVNGKGEVNWNDKEKLERVVENRRTTRNRRGTVKF